MVQKIRKVINIIGWILVLSYIATLIAVISFSYVYNFKTTDAAIILGAAVFNDEPSPVFAERLNQGQYLYEQGVIKKIIVTGGKSPEDVISEGEAGRNYLINKGVPRDDIYTDMTSTSTATNLLEAEKIMNADGLETALLVSDPLHMFRANLIARRVGLQVYSSPTRTSRIISLEEKTKFALKEAYYVLRFLSIGR